MIRIKILMIGVLTVLLSGCSEYEMIKYDSGGCINFMGFDERGYAYDDVKYLNWERNFGINSQGDSLLVDTIRVGVKISGELASYPRKVALKVKNVSEEGLEFIFRDDYVVPADTGRTEFQVYVKRPVQRNKEYKAELMFDYENSDFKAGTLERQSFKITCLDKITMELWGTNQFEWDEYYGMLFGEWSDTKIRFIITTVGAVSLPTWEASVDFYNDYFFLLEALEEYKLNPSNPPLLDDNGEWIEFPNIFG